MTSEVNSSLPSKGAPRNVARGVIACLAGAAALALIIALTPWGVLWAAVDFSKLGILLFTPAVWAANFPVKAVIACHVFVIAACACVLFKGVFSTSPTKMNKTEVALFGGVLLGFASLILGHAIGIELRKTNMPKSHAAYLSLSSGPVASEQNKHVFVSLLDSAAFIALEKGSSRLRAHRVTCEWLRGNGQSERWTLTINGKPHQKASCHNGANLAEWTAVNKASAG